MPKKRDGISKIIAVIVACATLSLAPRLYSQKAWPPISPEEVAMTDCPQQPGAVAIYLHREEVRDEKKGEVKVYKRLKILKAAGRDWGNIEIPYSKGWFKIVDLEARVVPAQGPPRDFEGPVFDKTALRGPGIRVAVKSFALPDVTPGAIIDYRFRLVPDRSKAKGKAEDLLDALQVGLEKPIEGDIDEGMQLLSFPVEVWDIQEDLFTRKAKFVYVQRGFPGFSLSWFAMHLQETHPVWNNNRIELEVENIPPFEAEDRMPPESSERMQVNLFYINSGFAFQPVYWTMECMNWQKAAEKFIGSPTKVVKVCRQIIAGETDSTKTLQRLYEQVQKIRNLSYEKGLTSRRRKEQNIKENRNVSDVLKHNYGYRSDITRTFVALAKAAGFEAEVARVSTRDDKLFDIKFLSFLGQLDSEAALVQLGDKTLLLDPATPFCPFGIVHWARSNTVAVRFSDKPPAFFRTPIYPPDLALTQREVLLRLDSKGNFAGTVKTTYTGHEALVRHLDHIHDDAEEIRKGMEEEMTALLPLGTNVAMTKIESAGDALVVEYDITVEGLATFAGNRMLLPVSPLLGKRQHPFPYAERKYPVYFPYPFREFNDIFITLPEGLSVESLPSPNKTQHEFSSYSLVCAHQEPQKLHVQRDLVIQKSYFPVAEYPALKAFYDIVRSGDTEKIVLRKSFSGGLIFLSIWPR